MGLQHMVIIQFKPGTADEQVAKLSAGLDSLPGSISQIRSYTHGASAEIRPGAWDYGVVAEFDSREDFEAYLTHPDHVALVRDLLDPISAARVSVQFTI